MPHAIHVTWDEPDPTDNIALHRVYYGASSGVYDGLNSPYEIAMPTLEAMVPVEAAAEWYVCVTAVNTDDVESPYSQEERLATGPLGVLAIALR